MEKILVVSYRFPPADETGTQRTWALAKYLKSMGFSPVFVTRNWNVPLKRLNDRYIPVGEEIEHKILEDYEVYILPNKNRLGLRINNRFREKYSFIRNTFNFIDQLLINHDSFILSEYRYFVKQAQKVIRSTPDIRKALVIADPFPLFYIGYLLKKRYDVNWIADYRDDWNTRTINDAYGFEPSILHKILYRFEKRSEKRWVKSAQYVTSVSEEYTRRISKLVGVKGVTVYNGFFEEDFKKYLVEQFPVRRDVDGRLNFTIVHNGTLYPTQPIELFANGLKSVIDEFKDRLSIQVKFIGVLYKPGAYQRIKDAFSGYESNYTCTNRIERGELYFEINQAQLALMVSHGESQKGITSSKIFDYIALKKQVLCCPSDGDVVEMILKDTNLGYFCNSEVEVYGFLKQEMTDYMDNICINRDVDYNKCLAYSRKNQTMKIADLLSRI